MQQLNFLSFWAGFMVKKVQSYEYLHVFSAKYTPGL